MLNVCAPSPPVPTISRTFIPGCGTGVACSRIATAHPDISSIVSALVLFVDSDARNAAFCVAVVWPVMISFMTLYASSYVRSPLFTIFLMASLIIFSSFGYHTMPSANTDKIIQDLFSLWCHDAFRMKLQSIEFSLFFLYGHHLSILRLSRYRKPCP